MPSKFEWESQKDVIRELYLNQDYTLKALQDRMNSAGFVATKSQYETKFKAWRFSKNDTNISAATWKHVGYKIAKRKRQDADSAVFIDGVEVNQKRVKKEVSRYTYSTIERVQLESIGAPSPPGPLAIVATPPSSQQAFSINYWPENLPCLAFVRSLNAHLPIVHQANKIPRTVHHGLFMSQSGPQADLLSRNDKTSIPGDSQISAHITTGRERLNLIQTILPHSSDPERVPEIQNSMALLSTTSSHWGLKLLIYLASNNLLKPEDLDDTWRLVEETGIKELANISKSLHLGETSLKAALEYLFEAGVWAFRTDIVSWLLDIGIEPNRRIRSKYLYGLHLPIVVALLGLKSWSSIAPNSMIRLLLSKGASTLLRCCEEHNNATFLATIDCKIDIDNLRRFLQASREAQGHQLSSQQPEYIYQEDETNRDGCEARQNRDAAFLTLESLVDVAERLLHNKSTPSATLVSPATLIKAVKSNNHRLIRIIHKRGLSMNCCDASRLSPLIAALEHGKYPYIDPIEVSIIELLLTLGASPNYDPYSSREGLCSHALQSALHYCSLRIRAKAVRMLIKSGATIQGSVSCGHENHQILMHCALRTEAEDGHMVDEDTLLALHEAGIPFPKTCLLDYMESIHEEVWADDQVSEGEVLKILPMLISMTPDFTLQSKKGWTALDYAMFILMKEAAELLFDKGAVNSRGFTHDVCLYGFCDFDALQTLFGRISESRSDRQNRTVLFYFVIGALRAQGFKTNQDTIDPRVWAMIYDYCKLPRSRRHETYIIQEVCATRNVYLIGRVLELFPNTYSPVAIEQLILYQTQHSVDNWKFIEELLRRRSNIFSPLQRLQETRIFLQAVCAALMYKDNSKVLEWFHNNSRKPFELANLNASAFLVNAVYLSFSRNIIGSLEWGKWKDLNDEHLYKYGLKTSTYLGLLVVCAGRVDQIGDLLHHGVRPNRRFAWSLTILQLAVDRTDFPMSRRLLEAGANVDARPPWRDIPESINCKIPHQVSEMLTTDSEKAYTKRRSALQLAVEQGNLSMIMLLLENGADLNGPPARVGGATAIQIACMKGYIDITKLLIERGADVNGAGAEYFGRTALEGAAEHGRLDTIFLLLESGCLVHGAFRKQYIRAVGFAKAQAHHTVAKELQDYGAWTNDDEVVLSSVNLRDIEPESRDLEEELHGDEDVSEIDSEDLDLEESEPLPSELDSETEFGDESSARDDEDIISSGQSTSTGIVDECGSSERGTEPQAVRLDTWDDLLEYYGEDERV